MKKSRKKSLTIVFSSVLVDKAFWTEITLCKIKVSFKDI